MNKTWLVVWGVLVACSHHDASPSQTKQPASEAMQAEPAETIAVCTSFAAK